MVSVQLHPDGCSGAKGALEGQRVCGAVFKVWVGEAHTELRLLSLQQNDTARFLQQVVIKLKVLQYSLPSPQQ